MGKAVAEGRTKRQHLRLSAMGPVEVVARGGAPRAAYLASIGRGGLGLYLHEPVGVGHLLLANLHLAAPQGDAEDLKVVVRARWAKEAGALWMAGFAFEQMSDARFRRLLEYLDLIEEWQLGERRAEERKKARFSVRD